MGTTDAVDPRPLYQRSAGEILTALGTDGQQGLTKQEARTRLERFGRNTLQTEKPVSAWRRFLEQFQSTLVVLLLTATAISVALWIYEHDTALPYEAIAIFAVVLLNAAMGYVQQARSEKALEALRSMSAARANVVRDGDRGSIPAAELVPGDIILIEEGDAIPADVRLIQVAALHTAEAALTGESLPVAKDAAPIADAGDTALGDRRNMAFSGTVATSGRGRAVVTATGMHTEMGRIAGMLQQAPDEATPLEKELDRVGKLLGIIVVVIAIAMIATILLVEDVHGFSAIFDVLIFGVALAVAAVPEGLPAVVTAVLALGVQRMATRNAIVRHRAAVETLGSANVIASDKTGTLTRNEMTVRRIVTASGRATVTGTGYLPEGEIRRDDGEVLDGTSRSEVLRTLCAARLANNAALKEHDGRWAVEGDPTEGALIVAARKADLTSQLDTRFVRIAEVPFSSERKLMSTVHRDTKEGGRLLVLTKGAPDVLLSRCSGELVGEATRPMTAERRSELMKRNDELADEALRTLGIAFRPLSEEALTHRGPDERVEQDLILLGLVGMIDPPRNEARQAVVRARQAGIRPIMITGDHPRTAGVIAADLGIAADGRTITGVELDRLSDDELLRSTREVSVYARVNPEHKLRLVKTLQRDGAIVGMTGDGVNDAPALKAADIGIAMGLTGTDVSRNAADMVLADDNFASIVAAIEEGRAIFANIRKFLRYLLSSNIGEVMTMFFAVVIAGVIGLVPEDGSGLVLPLTATQILWINLVTDGAPALALGADPDDPGIMKALPRPRSEGVITRRMWTGIFFIGAVMTVATLLILDASLSAGVIEGSGSLRYAQTMAFTTLTLCQLFNVFNARSDERSAFYRLFENHWLWAAVGSSLLLQVAVIYVPFLQQAFSTVSLSAGDWLRCAAAASSVLWLRELTKLAPVLTGRRQRREAR